MTALKLTLLPERFSVAQIPPHSQLPLDWSQNSPFFGMIRTPDEITVICLENSVPKGIRQEKGWRAIKVNGPLDFSLVGILAQLTAVLAQAGVSIFALSTFNTDYLLFKEENVEKAYQALIQAGYNFI